MQENIKTWLSQFLILSIAVAVILVVSGAALYLMQHGGDTVGYQNFSLKADSYTSFMQVIWGILQFKAMALVLLGFLILVLSQVVRVLVLGFYFAQSKEYWLAGCSFFIFFVLMYSLG